MESLTGRTARAVRWRFAGAVVGAAFQFVAGVVLARLLPPADFGIVALASILLGLLKPLSDLGVGTALLQRAEITERHVRAGFTFSVLAGIAFAGAIALAAPLGAALLGDERITSLLRVLGVALAARGPGVVAEALLARRLEFKALFFIESGTSTLGYGGVAIALAFAGHGPWSLVWGALVQAVLASAAQLVAGRHSLRPLVGRRELGELLRFGVGASLGSWVNYVALNADNFIVGRWLGPATLGLYGRAYALMNLPFTYAASVISGVLFPAFAQVQREPERLQRGFLLASQLTGIIAAPAMATLAVAAPHLIPALYGSAWSGAVPPLQILCLAGYFRALYHLGGVAARSVGRVYSELRLQMMYAAMVIGGSLLAAPYGLPWVAAAVSAAILCMFVGTTALALEATGMRWRQYLSVQRTAMVTGVMTGVVALGARLSLEAAGASTHAIALGVLAAASVPWGIGALLYLRRPEFEALNGSWVRVPGFVNPRTVDPTNQRT